MMMQMDDDEGDGRRTMEGQIDKSEKTILKKKRGTKYEKQNKTSESMKERRSVILPGTGKSVVKVG